MTFRLLEKVCKAVLPEGETWEALCLEVHRFHQEDAILLYFLFYTSFSLLLLHCCLPLSRPKTVGSVFFGLFVVLLLDTEKSIAVLVCYCLLLLVFAPLKYKL